MSFSPLRRGGSSLDGGVRKEDDGVRTERCRPVLISCEET